MHLDFVPDPSSCICIAHLKEAQRTHNDGYIPKWKRSFNPSQPSTKEQHCIYPSCSSTSKLITPSFASTDDLEALLQVQTTDEYPLVLCPKHYHELYYRFNKPLPCASCGVQPKEGTRFTRHSPNASLVNKFLYKCSEFEDTHMLCDEDYVCSSCYKNHLALVKLHEEQGKSSDMELNDLIVIWEYKMYDSDTDKLTRSVLHTASYVARELLNQRAVLYCQRCKNVPVSGATDTQIQEQLLPDSASQSEDSSTTDGSELSDDEEEDDSIITEVVTDTFDEYVIDMPF